MELPTPVPVDHHPPDVLTPAEKITVFHIVVANADKFKAVLLLAVMTAIAFLFVMANVINLIALAGMPVKKITAFLFAAAIAIAHNRVVGTHVVPITPSASANLNVFLDNGTAPLILAI